MKVIILTKEQAAKFPVIGIFERVEPIKDVNGNECLTPEQFKTVIYNKEIFELFTKEEILNMQLVDYLPPFDDAGEDYETQKTWYNKIIDKFLYYFTNK